jgi:hypothetical protein
VTLDELAARCGDAIPTATGYQTYCPAHADTNRSLSLGIGREDRLLVHCHAGCSLPNVLKSLGISVVALFPPHLRGKEGKRPEKDGTLGNEKPGWAAGLTAAEAALVGEERRFVQRLGPFRDWYRALDEARSFDGAAADLRRWASALGDTDEAWELLAAAQALVDEARRLDAVAGEVKP